MTEGNLAIARVMTPDDARVRSVFQARARHLAERVAEDLGRAAPSSLLTFRLGQERLAVPLTAVSEVLPLVGCVPVPGAPHEILGVINVRGEILPVVDLWRALGQDGERDGESGGYVLFLKRGGRRVGLRVDALDAVRTVRAGEVRPVEQMRTTLPARFVRGVTADTLIVLDADAVGALVASDEQ